MRLKKEVLVIVLMPLFGIALTFTIFEMAIRIKHRKFETKNFVEENWNIATLQFPIQHDPLLGWIPKEHFKQDSEKSEKSLTILSQGIRSNGFSKDWENDFKNTILAVGASTVFGSQVSDDETWPSYLERKIKQHVINAGVFAFGFDQVVLRLNELSKNIHPQRVILGIHPDNLNQVTMSQKYAKKPFFDIVEGALVLKNTPVKVTTKELSPLQEILGYSYLAHYILSKMVPNIWLENHGEIQAHTKEKEVSCLLVKRYEEICKKNNFKCSVLFEYFHTTVPEARNRVLALKTCLQNTNLAVWDTYEPLKKLQMANPEMYNSLYDFHMTPKGNAWIAEYIFDAIQRDEEHYPHVF